MPGEKRVEAVEARARNYLLSKQVEAMFVQITADLLRHQPEDPQPWLCERLCSSYLQNLIPRDEEDSQFSDDEMPPARFSAPPGGALSSTLTLFRQICGSQHQSIPCNLGDVQDY